MRDPNKGYLQLGYRWNGVWWNERDEFEIADFTLSSHQLRGSAGLFRGDFDLDFGIEYLGHTRELNLTTLATGDDSSFDFPVNNAFGLLAGSTWYATDSLALGLDMEWNREYYPSLVFSPGTARHQGRFRARIGTEWQPPVADPRVGATVGLSAGVGYNTYAVVISVLDLGGGRAGFDAKISSTVNNVYSFAYDIRLAVTLYFPGTSSLKERARQYQ